MMEYLELGKLVVAVITTIGAITVTFYHIGQSKKFRAELLNKLDDSIRNKSKHATCEIFRLLHGLRMDYADIITLVEDDNVAKIIYALKKTPGSVTYSNGKFQYKEISKHKWVKLVSEVLYKSLIFFIGFFLIVFILIMVFTEGESSLTAFVTVIGLSIIFSALLKQNAYDKMIESLTIK